MEDEFTLSAAAGLMTQVGPPITARFGRPTLRIKLSEAVARLWEQLHTHLSHSGLTKPPAPSGSLRPRGSNLHCHRRELSSCTHDWHVSP